MKLNLEIEIDWIDENHSIDDVVKNEIINGIIKNLDKKIEGRIEEQVTSAINDTVINKINTLTEGIFNDFTNREIAISDKYGDTIEVYGSLKDVIKKRFDNFLTQTVDEKGKTTTSRYGRTFRRIDYIIDNRLKEFAERFTKESVEKVSREIKLHVENGLKEHMGSKMMEVLEIPKLLKKGN